jgi:hypothetical protein
MRDGVGDGSLRSDCKFEQEQTHQTKSHIRLEELVINLYSSASLPTRRVHRDQPEVIVTAADSGRVVEFVTQSLGRELTVQGLHAICPRRYGRDEI